MTAKTDETTASPSPAIAPAVAVAETPEFKDALDVAMKKFKAEMLGDMVGAVTAALAHARPEHESGSASTAKEIALAIAEVADQGTNRKRVAPEILASRDKAKEEMGALILAARDLPPAEQPRYRLVAKVYLKERVIEPKQMTRDKRVVDTEIRWTGAPSAAMRPINASAEAIWDKFLGWIGGAIDAATAARPAWVTGSGLNVFSAPSATAVKHGMAQGVEVAGDVDDPDDLGVTTSEEQRVPDIAVLGTIAPKARNVAVGAMV